MKLRVLSALSALFLLSWLWQPVTCLEEGDRCVVNGARGTCTRIRACPSAIQLSKKRIKPALCSFREGQIIVCCEDLPTTVGAPVARMIEEKPHASTEIVFKDYCKPISYVQVKPGSKALAKCLEYQETLVYPCERGAGGGLVRTHNCNWRPEGLIINGNDATYGEFPHMALLGYGEGIVEWLCGGTLVSDRFVLTAAHCTVSAWRGRVTKIKIGILKRSEKAEPRKLYGVRETHVHPLYRSPLKYHDIALLETDRRMHLDRWAVPACLDASSKVDDSKVLVTGWGTTVFRRREEANTLQKVTLTRFPDEECSAKLHHVRLLPRGLDPDTQLCYGDKHSSKDSCNGDSGGAAVTQHPDIACMYVVTGIISWGKQCGVAGQPGVYTRVEHYLSWIEDIVWS